jgi:PAS domain S-box-containing protein
VLAHRQLIGTVAVLFGSSATLKRRLDALRETLQGLLRQASGWSDETVRDTLVSLLGQVEALELEALELEAAPSKSAQREDSQLAQVLDVLVAIARRDFTLRAPIYGDRPLDALARVANMLSEQLHATLQELALSRERYVLATEVGKVGTWDWSLETGVLMWSPQTFRLMDLEPDAIVPTYPIFLSLVHPDDRDGLDAAVHAALREQRPCDLDCRIVVRNGVSRVCHVSGSVQRGATGEPLRMLGTIQDVTERKQIEDELRLTKERYDFATSVGKVGTWDWNPMTGVLVWSAETFRLMGFEPDAVVPSYELYLGLVHPEDRAMLAAAVDAALYDHRPYDLDCRIVLGNGARLVCHVTGHVELDPEGKPIRMLGTIQDVTERKRIEDELRLTKERYDFATVVGKVGVWDWNQVTGDLAWSSETFQLLGFVPDSIVPTYELYLGLVHPEDRELLQRAVDAALHERIPYDLDCRIVRGDGTPLVCHVMGQVEFDAQGRPLRMLGTIQDVTERKRIEDELRLTKSQALAATVAKSRFLAHMSHEIRTPLTALLGFADLLAMPALNEGERLRYSTIVRRNSEHLLAVINDVLDLSRAEADQLTVELIECSPISILVDVVSLMRVRAQDAGLQLSLELATPVPERILSDSTRLRQIVLNMVGNAIKFTREGSVTIRALYDEQTRWLTIEVADTGIGIAPDQMANLFQPFHQADLSMTRRFGGSGLGLAISRALTEALGGTIDVTSRLGQGSTFRVSIPIGMKVGLISRLDDGTQPVASVGAPTRFEGSVLVVEDGVDNQVLLGALLRNYGLDVTFANDGESGIERAREAWHSPHPFDLILMDMQMPVLDGYRATEKLRSEGYRGPIIALTAHALEGEHQRCLAAGCDDYISKPIERRHLVAALGNYLGDPRTEDNPLHSTFADDPEMKPLVARFVAALPARIAELRAEAEVAGSTTLPRLVHQLKGAAGGYGFAPITAAAAELERILLADGDRTAVTRSIDELDRVCSRARAGTA